MKTRQLYSTTVFEAISPKQISDEIRAVILSNVNRDKSIREIADIVGCSKDAVYRARRCYDEDGRIKAKKRGGLKPTKLGEEHAKFIIDNIDADCTITLAALKTKLHERFGVVVSASTISKHIREFHYTFKRLAIVSERSTGPESIEKRYDYAVRFCRLRALGTSKLFFLDEAGFSVGMRLSYGRSPLGIKPQKATVALRSKNISLACCMGEEGVVFWKTSERAYNRNTFGKYLAELFSVLRERQIEGAIFVLDNVPFHHSQIIINSFAAHGHQTLFLPPYTPCLNPIEEMFSKIKAIVRRAETRVVDELFAAINNAHNLITSDDCKGYFEHMQHFIGLALDRQEFY